MKNKKINPRKRPATQADIKRAKTKAQNDTISIVATIFLTVLADKKGFDKEDIKFVWNEINKLSDSITEGYVNVSDLRKVLNEEYDVLV